MALLKDMVKVLLVRREHSFQNKDYERLRDEIEVKY